MGEGGATEANTHKTHTRHQGVYIYLRLRGCTGHSLRSPGHSAYGLCIRSARATLTTQLLESFGAARSHLWGVVGLQ